MQKVANGVLLGLVSLIAVIAVGVASVFTAAFALGATALIVPGTGTPNPNSYPEYVQDARNYYLHDTACGAPGACLDLGENLIGIDYPASFWPLTFIPGWCTVDCQKWDVSVAEGVDNLETAVAAALADPENPGQAVVIYGHSQGAAVVSNTLRSLNTSLTDTEKKRLQVVITGDVDNPAGGMWSRIGFLGRIPILDLTTGLPTPTDTGIKFTSIAMQYDGASNAPKYWGNLLALANAVAGFAYLHGTTLIPDERTPVGVPDYYPNVAAYLAAVYDPANAKQDSYGNTYIVVPSPTLPIVMPFLDLAARTGTTALVKPIVDLVSPVLRVLIDLGYDPDERPGVYSPLSVLPFSPNTNPLTVAADLIQAVAQGIHDAIHGGAPLPAPPTVSLAAAAPTTSPVAELDDVDAQPSMTTSRNGKSVEAEPSSSLGTNAIETTSSDGVIESSEATVPEEGPSSSASDPQGTEPTREIVSRSPDRGEADQGDHKNAGPPTDSTHASTTTKHNRTDTDKKTSENGSVRGTTGHHENAGAPTRSTHPSTTTKHNRTDKHNNNKASEGDSGNAAA